MARILLTGATGYIGGHLASQLVQRGDTVRCVVRASSDTSRLPKENTELLVADLSDLEAMRQAVQDCQVVYHLAAKTSALTRSTLYTTNADACGVIAQACARQDTPPTLVLVSSIAAAGTAIRGRRRGDTEWPHPVSEYGRSKRAGERAAAYYCRQVPLTVVRPSIVFGGANRELLPMFASIDRFRLHPIPGFLARRVALIQIDDLVDILCAAAERGERVTSPRGAGYYYASHPDCPTFTDLGRIISRALGAKPTLLMHVPEVTSWLAAAASQFVHRVQGRSETFNIDKMREAFAGNWIGSTTAIERELGYQPRASLQQQFDEAAQWYRQHQWL